MSVSRPKGATKDGSYQKPSSYQNSLPDKTCGAQPNGSDYRDRTRGLTGIYAHISFFSFSHLQ